MGGDGGEAGGNGNWGWRRGRRRWLLVAAFSFAGLAVALGWSLYSTWTPPPGPITDTDGLASLFARARSAAFAQLAAGLGPATYPAESRLADTGAYLDMLIGHRYILPSDKERMRGFVAVNVSVYDPRAAAFFVSRDYYDAWAGHRPPPAHYLVLTRFGQAYDGGAPGQKLVLPDRDPVFLKP